MLAKHRLSGMIHWEMNTKEREGEREREREREGGREREREREEGRGREREREREREGEGGREGQALWGRREHRLMEKPWKK